jgi:hypothetical protein
MNTYHRSFLPVSLGFFLPRLVYRTNLTSTWRYFHPRLTLPSRPPHRQPPCSNTWGWGAGLEAVCAKISDQSSSPTLILCSDRPYSAPARAPRISSLVAKDARRRTRSTMLFLHPSTWLTTRRCSSRHPSILPRFPSNHSRHWNSKTSDVYLKASGLGSIYIIIYPHCTRLSPGLPYIFTYKRHFVLIKVFS